MSLILLDLDYDWPSEIERLDRFLEERPTWEDGEVTLRRLYQLGFDRLARESSATDGFVPDEIRRVLKWLSA